RFSSKSEFRAASWDSASSSRRSSSDFSAASTAPGSEAARANVPQTWVQRASAFTHALLAHPAGSPGVLAVQLYVGLSEPSLLFERVLTGSGPPQESQRASPPRSR